MSERRETQATAEREAKEKADNIANRFNTAMGENNFSHEAIKADYLKKFGTALDNTPLRVQVSLKRANTNAPRGFCFCLLARQPNTLTLIIKRLSTA